MIVLSPLVVRICDNPSFACFIEKTQFGLTRKKVTRASESTAEDGDLATHQPVVKLSTLGSNQVTAKSGQPNVAVNPEMHTDFRIERRQPTNRIGRVVGQ